MKDGHGSQSQHYAGTAFDVGQNLNSVGREELRRSAINSGVWSYVEPASITPTWVNVFYHIFCFFILLNKVEKYGINKLDDLQSKY